MALLATGLLAFSYHHIDFSQNARGYTGMLLATLLGSAFFVDLLQSRGGRAGPRLALGYGASMALATASHPMAVMAVAAHGVVWLALLVTRWRSPVGGARWVPGWGFLLSASLSLCLYALVLPQFVGLITEPPGMVEKTEWKDPMWMLTETLRGLAQGLPGGWLAILAGGLVGGLGLASFARQSWAVLGILLLGTALTASAILALNLNLWPRYFFLFAGFGVLIACRGVYEWVDLLLGNRRAAVRRTANVVAGVSVVAASAWTLPAGYAPKQDYGGAWALVEESLRPGDAVVTTDMTTYILGEHLRVETLDVSQPDDLQGIEAEHARTWFLYTFPTRLQAVHPELWDHVEDHYREAGTFWGTVRGGEVVVMVRE